MGRIRAIAPHAALVGWLAFGLGVALMLGATVVYGDWYLIRRPWSEISLGLIVWGLGLAALFSIVVVFWPIRWATLLALPGIALTGFFWLLTQAVPLSGG